MKQAITLAALLLCIILLAGCAARKPDTASESIDKPVTTHLDTDEDLPRETIADTPEDLLTEPAPETEYFPEDLPPEAESEVFEPTEYEREEDDPEETEPAETEPVEFTTPLPEGCDYTEAFRYALCCEYYCLSWDWPWHLQMGESAGNFYLGDIDDDGTPELLSDAFGMDGTNFLIYDFADGELLSCGPTFDRSWEEQGWESVDVLLIQPDCYCICNTGTKEMGISDLTSYSMLDRNLQTGYWGPDYVELPDHGSMSKPEEAIYSVEYTLYACYAQDYRIPIGEDAVPYLLTFRDVETGDTYYMDQNGYITEEEYLELEQRILDRSEREVLVGIDEGLFPQLPQVKLESMTVFELADALGGLDDRPEWANAKEILETFRP